MEPLIPTPYEGLFSLRRPGSPSPMKELSLSGGQEQGEPLNPPFNAGIFSLRRPGTGRIFKSSFQQRNFLSQEARNRENL